MFTALSDGNYTAEIQPQTGVGGIALAEVYSEGASPGADLINLATRAEVLTDRPVVAGFTILGSGTRQVLVRAVGPTLATFGVLGTVPNPKVRLMQGTSFRAENDDWSLDPNAGFTAAAARQVGAFALPIGSQDSALLITLEAGSYTAIVEPADNRGGIALVEIYDVTK